MTAGELRIGRPARGVTPTQDDHLTTKLYVDQHDHDDQYAPLGLGATTNYNGNVQTTTSTTWVDLGGPSIVLDLVTPRTVLIIVTARLYQSSAPAAVYMSWSASGATVVAPEDHFGVRHNGSGNRERSSAAFSLTINAGLTVITPRYRVDGGTGEVAHRHIVAIPL